MLKMQNAFRGRFLHIGRVITIPMRSSAKKRGFLLTLKNKKLKKPYVDDVPEFFELRIDIYYFYLFFFKFVALRW